MTRNRIAAMLLAVAVALLISTPALADGNIPEPTNSVMSLNYGG